MKRYSIIALLTILSSYIYAQDVWTEGTTWDVEYTQESNIPHTLFTLMKAMDIEGVSYHPLTASTDEGCDTIAYIRSEHGDSLVFARVICNGILLPESLLYDFSKSFKYGDILQYATTEGTFTECISYEEDPITYLYDIFEEGDRIPMWKGIIYKIGHIEGPLGLFFVEPIEGPSTIKPKPTNVSHILFGTKKNDSKVLYSKSVTNSINRTSPVINTPVIYNLCGIRLYSVSKRGLYIIDGKKVMK
ncbi:MAG: hypothetical protein MJZ41_11720 [Bacteroidaceae bacterium]|nr:hypothetical protein [Bacteroidaceae bacterium]